MVIDDAPAELVPLSINLGVDLRLVEAVVRPAGPRASARRQVHAEAADLAAAPAPVLHVTAARLPQGESHGWLIVAHDIEEDSIAGTVVLLERVDDVEEEEGVCLVNSCVLASDPVDEPDEGRALGLPGVVVVQVALVLARHQPTAFCAHHSIPVEGVRNLDHDDVLLSQRDRMHRRGEFRLDPRDEPPVQRGAGLARLVGLHREDNVLGLEPHGLRADAQLDGAGEPLAGDGIQVRLGVEDERPALHELVPEWQLAQRSHVAECEL
mmetsp:Transcript_84494/g.234284  ORF Transcript_84494/g.234284 Transcript_84494/m.234284 type:complete len:267 (+) Transcript_84494:534-1334(+)